MKMRAPDSIVIISVAVVLAAVVATVIDEAYNSSGNTKTENHSHEIYQHPLDKNYDSLANIFTDVHYSEKLLNQIIFDYGPLIFRKENNNWHIYHFNTHIFYRGTRFKLYRIPLDSIYDKEFTILEKNEKFYDEDLFGDDVNDYLIGYRNNLDKIYSAEGINYDYKNKSYESYELSNDLKIVDFGVDIGRDIVEYVNGSAKVYNTTNQKIKNIKLKISVYDNHINGNIITEDYFTIKDSLNSGEMKIVMIKYKPNVAFVGKGLIPMTIDIIKTERY